MMTDTEMIEGLRIVRACRWRGATASDTPLCQVCRDLLAKMQAALEERY